MPPKPWETKGAQPAPNISEVIQSNPTAKQQIPKIINNPNQPLTATSSLAATGTGLGSSYGGYSGYSSGLGSYGGLGGMYGGGYGGYGGYGMGMGGMYGMGMMGMQQNPNLMNSMIALQSLGYLINSLCDIARSLDQNYEGLQLFKQSFKSLSSKVENGVKGSVTGAGHKTKSACLSVVEFIKKYILCMGKRDQKSKQRSVRLMTAIAAFLLIISFYPVLRRYIKLK